MIEETALRHSVIPEVSDAKAFASDRARSESKRLPGVPDVVQAVSICPVPILPSFAPGNAGQNENKRGGAADKFPDKVSDAALFCHVGRGPVMIEAIGPFHESPRAEVKFGRMEIAGGGIDAQRVDASG
jgi:hypothetical protein